MSTTPRISRDLDAAREAYDQAEISPDYARMRSMEMHQVHSEPKECGHCDVDYSLDAALQGFVSGAAHGCLSLACLVGSGVCSLSQGGRFVLVSAAGLGMIRGYDSFTTSDLYSRYYRREQARENWEIKNYIEGEKREMVELWTSRGLDEGTATDVIEKISKHPAFFADIMMKDELNLPYPDAHPLETSISGCFGFLGGACIASLPVVLLSRFSDMSTTHSHRSTLSASVAVAAAAVAAANYKRYDSKNISSPGTLALSSLTFALAITATVTAARAALRL